MKNILIVPHLKKNEALKAMRDLLKSLEKRHLKPGLLPGDAAELGLEKYGMDKAVLEEKGLVIVLGGDGTILRAVRSLKGLDIPVLGVNFGRIGFLSEVEYGELEHALTKVLAGEYLIEKRMLLKGELNTKEGKVIVKSLNEIALLKSEGSRLVRLNVKINDEPFWKYICDGLIFATPTGSTAYSLSAGGPVASTEAPVYLMTPVCAHSFFNRSFILSLSERATISPEEKSAGIKILADGEEIYKGRTLESLKISDSGENASLVRFKARGLTLIKDKLREWGSKA